MKKRSKLSPWITKLSRRLLTDDEEDYSFVENEMSFDFEKLPEKLKTFLNTPGVDKILNVKDTTGLTKMLKMRRSIIQRTQKSSSVN